jgi:hypothetical protein
VIAPDRIALKELRRFERKDLEVLLARLNGSHAALKRDECGEWTIAGSRGVVQVANGLFTIHVYRRSPRRWGFIKRVLEDFASEARGGQALRLDRLPDGEDECGWLRHVIGLRQTRPASSADRLHRGSRENATTDSTADCPESKRVPEEGSA